MHRKQMVQSRQWMTMAETTSSKPPPHPAGCCTGWSGACCPHNPSALIWDRCYCPAGQHPVPLPYLSSTVRPSLRTVGAPAASLQPRWSMLRPAPVPAWQRTVCSLLPRRRLRCGGQFLWCRIQARSGQLPDLENIPDRKCQDIYKTCVHNIKHTALVQWICLQPRIINININISNIKNSSGGRALEELHIDTSN